MSQCPGCGYPHIPDDEGAMAPTAQWHRDHYTAHLAQHPDIDQRSADNLVARIREAEAREGDGQ